MPHKSFTKFYERKINHFVIFLSKIVRHYKLFDIKNTDFEPLLPSAPNDQEKYSYVNRHVNVLTFFSTLSFTGITISTTRLYMEKAYMYPLFFILGYTIIYFIFSLRVNLFPKDFNIKKHEQLTMGWKPQKYPSVDVFLPTCGEPVEILKNTWNGVNEMKSAYYGITNVYCLDDSHNPELKKMANDYKFNYFARPNKGWFKKAGNLRYGFENSNGDFIAIFDADFRPRHDFINEILPYFYNDIRLGIVQSPQYFEVNNKQNWLERGAGAVQEFFYRAIQVSRQSHGGGQYVSAVMQSIVAKHFKILEEQLSLSTQKTYILWF